MSAAGNTVLTPQGAHAGSRPDMDPGLPRWVLPISLLGLAILVISTLPALVARRRLEHAERRIAEEVRSMDEAADRTRRDLRAIRDDAYVIDRALRDLLEPGPRVAAPKYNNP